MTEVFVAILTLILGTAIVVTTMIITAATMAFIAKWLIDKWEQ